MPHDYRITVDALRPGEEGAESVSFFATTAADLLAQADRLRERLGCSACDATRLALGYGLLNRQEP